MSDLEHIVMKSRDAAAGGRGVLSTGEALAAALVLNRPDWLAEMGYTIAEALQRIGPEWVALIPQAAKALERANESLAEAARTSRQEAALKSMGDDGEVIYSQAKLVTYGVAPGYRSVSLVVDLSLIGTAITRRFDMHISPKDGEAIASHILEAHRVAWDRSAGAPLDAEPGEKRPRRIGD